MAVDGTVQRVKVPAPIVVKLGGSLAENDRVGGALDIVSRASRRVVVVPGGGPFADAVRQAQADHQFSNEAAHRMAILAMHQMAELLMDLQPRLKGADSIAAMRGVWRNGEIPVWLPHKMCEDDNEIPADWSITSDGLAARLAERLRCPQMVLVKSCNAPEGASAFDLAREGIVDQIFPAIVGRAKIDWVVIGPGEEVDLADLLGSSRPRAERPSDLVRRMKSNTI
jgi:aspartokinase-like uncharacterized kinase